MGEAVGGDCHSPEFHTLQRNHPNRIAAMGPGGMCLGMQVPVLCITGHNLCRLLYVIRGRVEGMPK